MSSKRVKRLGFSSLVLERLTRNNLITCKDVLNKSRLELIRLLGLSDGHVRDIITRTCRAVAPDPVCALELLKSHQSSSAAAGFLPTSLPQLDQVLHGGLPVGTITEVAGPSGCGKTQFCVMMSVLTTLPRSQGGLEGGVMYIDTESAFSAERLVEVAQSRYPEHFDSEESLMKLTQSVHVCIESTCASLWKRLQTLEEEIITKHIKLVILDSVASLIRKEFDSRSSKNMIERTSLLAKEAALLKYIAETFNIPILVTNQITTRYGNHDKHEDEGQGGSSLEGSDGYVTAALGNTWSHSVNTRLIVQYLDGPRRQVLVAKSPIAPFSTFVYTIKDKGFVLEEGGAEHYDGTDPGLQKIRVRTSLPQHAFQY